MMRWWWFGPSVTTREIEREMRQMKEGGIGGFEIQPTYPLALDDPPSGLRNYPYLSAEFLKALRFAAEKARELGLRMDLTLGSGWPFGGPHIPITQAAGRLRTVRAAASAQQPAVAEGERLIGNSLTAAPGDPVQFFIAGRTRMMVKRPAVGAEGFVLDHYDRSAIDNHLKNVGEKLMGALAGVPPHAIFSDSLEVNGSDWTGDLLEQFQKRRGYDLIPYLDLLARAGDEKSAAVRHDWGKTLTELAEERYLAPVAQWARQHGTLFRSQTYGTPPVTLASAALVDLPEGEGSQWRRFSTSRWASSASHLSGKPVTSSETWTWLHSPVFRATPLDMKAEADLHFLQGINQLIGHGWPYSPPEAGEPGWRFYAAAVFNAHNPWWIAMPDIARYLQRVSFLLRQGTPANDVALYLPVSDAYARFTPGRASVNEAMDGLIGPNTIPAILDAGYNFDFIDDGMMAQAGVPHRILILPGAERMPLATCRRIEEYARKGGIVIALRRAPSLAPGLQDAADTPAVQQFSGTLFEQKGAPGRLVADAGKLAEALHAALPPDLAAPPEIGFVHRRLPFADVYFLANTSNHAVRGEARFRIAGRNAGWWDPYTGGMTAAPGARMALDLAPYESRVLVFSAERAPGAPAPARPAPPAVELASGWKVTFDGAPPVALGALRSWADDSERKFYSGRATYETIALIPKATVASGRRLYLNFGEGTPVTAQERRAGSGMRAMLESPVREAAQVYVNGKPAGAVWHPPYEIDVTALVRAGENAIRVVVGNLAINALAKGPLPDYRELNARYGERFQPQDMANLQPLPSGLLGPVRLIAK